MSLPLQSLPILLEINSSDEVASLIAPVQLNDNPDVIILNQNDEPVTIEMVRTLPQLMAQQPYFQEQKWVIIHHLDLANEVAQNSLLKSLEDHPAYVRFLLTCQHASGILGTVRSRCQLHVSTQSAHTTSSESEGNLPKMLTASAGEKIALCEKITTVAHAIAQLSELLVWQHRELERKPTHDAVENLKVIQQGLTMALANTSPRACVEWTLLHLTAADESFPHRNGMI